MPPLRHLAGPLGGLMPEVAPDDGEVVVKLYASAFFGTAPASTLTALRVGTLLIAGVSTSGFVPVVVRQGVGERDPGPQGADLFGIGAQYCEVWEEAVRRRLAASY